MIKLTNNQTDALFALYKAVSYGENAISGSLPNSPGMMTKVQDPLAGALALIKKALEKCQAQGL